MQADDLPFAIDLLPHIGFERSDGADFTIWRASPIVDEGRRDGNLFSGHHLNDKNVDSSSLYFVPNDSVYVRSTRRIFVRINIWNQLGPHE